MLQVKDVRKKYITGDFEQIALDGVSLNLRDNEFVAILGPSGSGKTTLLNIIGGLDRYDSGDLVINGVSTKKYKDRDWDSYRNHTVGFVFQSYNLIPHQTVLANVELALTIGGISSAQRKKMALDALEQVGLREQAHKKPNQMSGGQMQRVAIARALVNNPKILLADEPTGALDTKTSVQVMDLLKEVAKDRLVVMVTHNPELAEEYANRIVRVKDGNIIDDTNPLVIAEEEPAIHKNLGKASMSLFTSFGLSLNNLMTKKGRTFMTAFAGSIGIIGIALILSLSTGFQAYIDQIQEETMTSYPLTIYEETTNALAAILTMHSNDDEEIEDGVVVERQYIASMMGSISKNDLTYFKKYLEDHEEEYIDEINMIRYSYSVTPLIYTVDAAENLAQINPNATLNAYMGGGGSYMSALTGGSSMTSSFSEINDLDVMKDEYEVLAGRWPENYDEMVIVLSNPNQISDMLLYSLGLRDTKELKTIIQDVMSGETVENENEPMKVTYQQLLDLDLKLVDPSSRYRYNEQYGTYEDMRDDTAFMEKVYEEAEDLHIVGIVHPEENGASIGVMYLPELTHHVMALAGESEIVQKQLADKDTDVFSGNLFSDEEDEDKEGLKFEDMISIDEDKIAEAFQTDIDPDAFSGLGGGFNVGIDQNQMAGIVMGASQEVADNLEEVTKSMVQVTSTLYEQTAVGVTSGLIEMYKSMFTVSLPADMGGISGGLPGGLPGFLPGGMSSMERRSLNPMGRNAQMILKTEAVEEVTPSVAQPVAENNSSVQPVSSSESGQPVTEVIPSENNTTGDSIGTGNVSAGTEIPEGTEAPEGTEVPEGTESPEGTEIPEGGDGQGTIPGFPGTGDNGGFPSIPGSGSGDSTQYLMVTVGGVYMPDVVMAQAQFQEGLNTAVDQIIKAMDENMGTPAEGEMPMKLSLNPDTLKKIITDSFKSYFTSLTPNQMGMVPVSDLPDPAATVSTVMKNYDTTIFGEAYDMAKEVTTYVVAAGVGQAVSQIMTPVMSGLASSLSGLAGLGDMFSGDFLTIDQDKFAEAFQFDMDEDELSRLMESMMTNDNASYNGNLLKLGYQDLDAPTSISFYFKDFESKGDFTDWLENYNDIQEEEQKLTYSDITGLLMGSVETIINSVTYVLIAFVSISLIVSSIMIGIITYISVLERTKEIGILRAIGASKRNISTIFNAETFIIGFLSGLIGVITTWLLNFPVNMVIHNVTGNPDITAILQLIPAIALVIIATLLTMIGGLIPSRSASRKDPVIALRSE